MDIKEILIAAKTKISTPETWCISAEARNKFGEYVNSISEHAVQWCMIGALKSVIPVMGDDDYLAVYGASKTALITAMCKITPFMNIPDFNDRCGHAAVIKAFDLAIDSL